MIMDVVGAGTLALAGMAARRMRAANEQIAARKAKEEREAVVVRKKKRAPRKKAPRIEPVIRVETGERVARERQIKLFDNPPDTELPPLSLLDEPSDEGGGYSSEALNAMSRLLELKLADFGVQHALFR